MITGCVVAESLRPGAVLELAGLRMCRVSRVDLAGSARGSQPPVWTILEFESDAEDDTPLAQALSDGLSPDGGWYADYRVGDRERVVVFAGRVFRYSGADDPRRLEAVAHGASVGVPEHQLDWKD
ncbi:hypothetical protein [Streptomyces fuscichromogenes]|uniref:Uncharacterized protein n=1 Tax=Streptomyces fuscichromogenes TaxID=1324013 RepID=A0A917XFT0_9ACTN|nr:hypothetical protein [Streptomyces fuscichromogenes]GGN21275.1 hypothetical protein GCM10011578_052300 [Streptomyces fuscichromogenes]